jgi:hypothetical protein
MTAALANGYAISFSPEANASWQAKLLARYGPDPAMTARTGASLGRLANRLPRNVRQRAN